MEFFNHYIKEEISTGVLLLIVFLSRAFVSKIIRRYAKTSEIIERRTNLVIKYINVLITILAIITLILIWGVQAKDIFITVSSVATVIGVAMFAQWSILSNITSGIILFFSFPFKIGDVILIHDKDYRLKAKLKILELFTLQYVQRKVKWLFIQIIYFFKKEFR